METILSLSGTEGGGFGLMCFLEECGKVGVPTDLSARLMQLATLCHMTRSGVIFMANGILADLASDEIASCGSLNPLETPRTSESHFRQGCGETRRRRGLYTDVGHPVPLSGGKVPEVGILQVRVRAGRQGAAVLRCRG
jgi:hypothetical protein